MDSWDRTSTQWNEWKCAFCFTQTRLLDGIMDLNPSREDLWSPDDAKLSRILNTREYPNAVNQ